MDNKKNRVFTVVLLAVYGMILIWIVLLKASSFADLAYLPCPRSINLIPFHYDTEVKTHLSEIILNVLVFVPLGIFLGMLGINVWKAVLIGFAVSFVLEALQYFLSIGAADITDLITNTIGAAFGACGYLLLCLIFRKPDRLNRVLNVLACIGMALFLGFAAFLLIANR